MYTTNGTAAFGQTTNLAQAIYGYAYTFSMSPDIDPNQNNNKYEVIGASHIAFSAAAAILSAVMLTG